MRQEHKQAGRPHRRQPGRSGRPRGAPSSPGSTAAATSTTTTAATAAAAAAAASGSMRGSPQQAVPVPLLRQELQLEADPETGEEGKESKGQKGVGTSLTQIRCMRLAKGDNVIFFLAPVRTSKLMHLVPYVSESSWKGCVFSHSGSFRPSRNPNEPIRHKDSIICFMKQSEVGKI